MIWNVEVKKRKRVRQHRARATASKPTELLGKEAGDQT